MEDFLYAYNQPKKFGKYDLILDGKITANEFVYKVLTEDKEIENINLADKVKEIESKLQTHFTFETVTELPTEGEETVIYLVPNDEQSGDKDGYDEYMWVKEKGGFELIGSGTYAKQQADLQKEITDRTNADTALDEKIANRVVINEPITITEGYNTTSITSDTISTTTLSGTLDAESMKNSLTAEAVQNVVPMAWNEWTTPPSVGGRENIVIGNGAVSLNRGNVVIGWEAKQTDGWGVESIIIGHGANGYGNQAIAIGKNAHIERNYTTVLGYAAIGRGGHAIAVGAEATVGGQFSIAIGRISKVSKPTALTIGSQFTETTDSGYVTHTCTTEGTGSITIGAGANTLNTTTTVDGVETTVESSNSITIGCKAENHNPDSIVIGASAKLNAPEAYGRRSGSIVIGAGAQSQSVGGIAIGNRANTHFALDGIAIGTGARANANTVAIGSTTDAGMGSTAIGYFSKAPAYTCAAVGCQAEARAKTSSAFGVKSVAADEGVCVFSSYINGGNKTQLYFSGTDTPLAKKYFPTAWEKKQDVDEQGNPKVDENGEPVMIDDKDKPIAGEAMMGFVARDSAGNIIARGANMLSALFPYYNGDNENPFTPTTMSLDGEKQEPIAFHPSDLDIPIEEAPIEEEYKPLPIYPIVEPTIDEITE